MLAVVGVVASLAGLVWWRARYFRAMTALTMRHRMLGPDGVVVGGGTFELQREGAPAVLLLHGGGDTPQTLRYLGDVLHAHGFHVFAPLLPGHGRTLNEFARVRAADLTAAADEGYRALRERHDWVGVIGLSMGGALAVQLAAAHRDLPALGLVAPYLAMPPRVERFTKLSWIWGIALPATRSSEGRSVLDPDERARNLAYGVFTAGALRALRGSVQRAASALPLVTAPTLMIQSREDNRISVESAERAFARLGSPDKTLEWVTGAAHIITVDFGRDVVIAQLAAFMEARCTPRARTPSAGDSSP
jgi:Esterase/lipase